jgi:hypothetical protein
VKRVALVVSSALAGGVFCFAWVALLDYLGGGVQFPAPRGETDFSERFVFFLFGICPAFVVLGAWIGRVSLSRWRLWIAMWLGVIAASLLVEIVVRGLRAFFESMTESSDATRAVICVFLAWVAAAAFGAWVGRKISSV